MQCILKLVWLTVSCTPGDVGSKLSSDEEPFLKDILYQSLTDALEYLKITHHDISYFVHKACLFMHDPCLPHFNHIKHIL
jgi:hypothetical protein